ncbi:MAG TPA: right-handed parallel beta-helix repeat-containing protein [bacterium]|nr:right-handed parallel beta-helix repeat-containing protein [bacterium]
MKIMQYLRIVAFAAVLALFAASSAFAASAQSAAPAATFLVTNTADSGPGSLRQAMLDADAAAGADQIHFHIPLADPGYDAAAGVWTIRPLTWLPHLDDDLTVIDGLTQRSFHGLDPSSSHPVICILNNGTVNNGFTINGSSICLIGLTISGFSDHAVLIRGDHNRVSNCLINTDASGMQRHPNSTRGIEIWGGDHNTIGGETAAQRNTVVAPQNSIAIVISQGGRRNAIANNFIGLNCAGDDTLGCRVGIFMTENSHLNTIGPGNTIAGCVHDGIEIYDCDSTRVIGNIIGLDAGGTIALGNQFAGIRLHGRSSHAVIGGSTEGERNIVSANGYGILIPSEDCRHSRILGNWIGTDLAGTSAIPNTTGIELMAALTVVGEETAGCGNVISGNLENGIQLLYAEASENRIAGNRIGVAADGTTPLPNGQHGIEVNTGAQKNTIGPGNVIACNAGAGVAVIDPNSTENTITRNSIFANGTMGIDLQAGNRYIPAPTLTSLAPVTGTAPAHARVEIFAGPDGQGRTCLATVTADAAGAFSWSGALSGAFVTATATDADGNTSEFSDPLATAVPDPDRQTPAQFDLLPNYPNPFNPTTAILFDLPRPARVELTVYSIDGKRVKSLENRNLQAGRHQRLWDGTDRNGIRVASGVYFYRLQAISIDSQAPLYFCSKKMALTK